MGEEEAGLRLFQVAHDPRCAKSGVYWSWNGGPREGRGAEALEKGGQITGGGGAGGGWDSIYENDQSDKVLNQDTASDLFKYSTIVTGAEWPPANQPKSPCPTLKVIGAITAYQNKKEELKRMKQGPGMVAGKGIVITATAAKAVDAGSSILLLPLRVLQRVLLGKLPEKATSGSFQETKVKRRGGLLTFWRSKPAVVEEAVVEAVVEDELDPEVEANQRLRDELEEELRAKIQAQAALDGGMAPPDGIDEAAPAGELETSR